MGIKDVSRPPFHGYSDLTTRPYQTYRTDVGWTGAIARHITTQERLLSYQFYPHFHPYVAELVSRLVAKGLAGLQDADTDYQKNPDGTLVMLPDGTTPRPTLYEELFTSDSYDPNPDTVPNTDASPWPVRDLDFTSGGAYAVYNWELFYHIPLEVAIHLSKNQRFEEAQNWFHYIFDPTDNSDGPTPERFWKVKPFQSTPVEMIEDILVNLSTGADPTLYDETIQSLNKWKEQPFQPFLIAHYRPTAYMFKTVMAYLDNLIAWGDSLFQQDSVESINEATQLYVLAANILGQRPQEVPRKGSIRPQTYADLRADLDAFGNALRDIETDIPFDLTLQPSSAVQKEKLAVLHSAGNALYFCVPRNDKLLGYWDMVADRLFKIHNSLNFQGIFRQLPLFQPPIDPALLVRAAAAGLDIGAVVSGLNQPLPLVRFQLLLQKATEICQEVKSLGSGLLAALEKGDNEALAVLRAQHESSILTLAKTVKYQHWQEAIASQKGLEKSLANAVRRYTYYEMQLGTQPSDIQAALLALDPLDTETLNTMQYTQNETDKEMAVRPLPAVDIAQDLTAASQKLISSYEATELDRLDKAHSFHATAIARNMLGTELSQIPQFDADFQPLGVGGGTGFGGVQLSKMMSIMVDVAKTFAEQATYEATMAGKIGGYERRQMEWTYQSGQAAGEINQIYKQLRAAQIRANLMEQELKNHQQQIDNAADIEHFLNGEKVDGVIKETTRDFYLWMKGQVKSLYGQCFQFAFDVARKAERALQRELGDTSLSFLQTGYLAGKEGLLAGEQLFQDLKRMEMAYHDLNQREYELTKNVSLLQLDPLALLRLRRTGSCTLTLPEELFDLDSPCYFRRIKTVAVSIPCVVGPYTSVPCTLTLLKSSIRTVSDGDYARTGADDPRFSDYFGSLQSIVTSTGQNDSGLFETNLRDERYLPFEGSGVISEWQLELPAELPQFDYETIADVILHVRYTAREGGALLRQGAIVNLKKAIASAQTVGSVRLFSIRHDFPTEWAKFKNIQLGGTTSLAELSLTLRAEHYPFWSQGLLMTIQHMDFFVQTESNMPLTLADGTGNEDKLTPDQTLKLQVGSFKNIPLPAPLGKMTLYLNDNSMDDLWLAVTWSGAK